MKRRWIKRYTLDTPCANHVQDMIAKTLVNVVVVAPDVLCFLQPEFKIMAMMGRELLARLACTSEMCYSCLAVVWQAWLPVICNKSRSAQIVVLTKFAWICRFSSAALEYGRDTGKKFCWSTLSCLFFSQPLSICFDNCLDCYYSFRNNNHENQLVHFWALLSIPSRRKTNNCWLYSSFGTGGLRGIKGTMEVPLAPW